MLLCNIIEPPFTHKTINYWRKKWHNELLLEHEGLSKTNTGLSKQAKHKCLSIPLLINDNLLDTSFKTFNNNLFKPVVYDVVIDIFYDYTLSHTMGYSIAKEFVKKTYCNANNHLMQLIGDRYVWKQIQTDYWGINGENTIKIEPFYNSVSTFMSTSLKNSQAKYIGHSFGSVWHNVLKRMFPHNYSIYNLITNQKLNSDNLKPTYLPLIKNSEKNNVIKFLEAIRHTKHTVCELTRKQEWLQAFNIKKQKT